METKEIASSSSVETKPLVTTTKKRKKPEKNNNVMKDCETCIENPKLDKYRCEFSNHFTKIQEKLSKFYEPIPNLIPAINQGLHAMDTLTQLDRIYNRHRTKLNREQEYQKTLKKFNTSMKPGDFFWTASKPINELHIVLFQVVHLTPSGLLTIRLFHIQKMPHVNNHGFHLQFKYRNHIPDKFWTMPIGTDTKVKMTRSGVFSMDQSCQLYHLPLRQLSVISYLSKTLTEKHPLQDSRIFDRLILLSTIDHILNIL
jgi:hypothetical protein